MVQRTRFLLISLTALFILAQLSFFTIHYNVSELLDSLVKSSLQLELFAYVIFIPIFIYFIIQLLGYSLFLIWIFFLTQALSELYQLKKYSAYLLALSLWCLGITCILSLNQYFFPHSFFAFLNYNEIILISSVTLFLLTTLFAFYHFFWFNITLVSGWILLIFFAAVITEAGIEKYFYKPFFKNQAMPNIIIIGFDSLRPDKIHPTSMPTLYQLLAQSTVYSNAYTPLARTLPAWMSLFTSRYPKNINVRGNLAAYEHLFSGNNLPMILKLNGYETVYATDQPRYTEISKQLGFTKLIGPKTGIVEFLLGSFNDFPLNNLLLKLPGAHFLFPYNYANRAAEVTYEPNDFIKLLKKKLTKHEDKPLFLAIHFTLSHWPFTWATGPYSENTTQALRYQLSLQALDKQFKRFFYLLQNANLLNNTLVFFISDHGVTLGQPNERLLEEANYVGNKKDLRFLTRFQLANDNESNFSLSTSYGQGTDVLSLLQYRILFAVKSFGIHLPQQFPSTFTTIMDITPSILQILSLKNLSDIDGKMIFIQSEDRPFFIETADVVEGMEIDKIEPYKIVKQNLNVYRIDDRTGQLYFKPSAYYSLIQQKQRAMIWHDWLLARYPSTRQFKIVDESNEEVVTSIAEVQKNKVLRYKLLPQEPYFILMNLSNKKWTINFDSEFAQQAPVASLMAAFKHFYGDEVSE